MTELREFLDAELEKHSPPGQPEIASIQHRVTVRRQRRRAATGLVGAAVITAVGVVAFQLQGPSVGTDPSPLARPSTSPSASPSDERRGEVAANSTSSCVEQYSPAAVATRAFAFDGTVTSIDEDARQTDTSLGGADSWEVTFEVHEWFSGGDAQSVVVSLFRPIPSSDERPAGYEEGTRLLVSGEDSVAGASYLAWTCGFTRYFDSETADQWRAATS